MQGYNAQKHHPTYQNHFRLILALILLPLTLALLFLVTAQPGLAGYNARHYYWTWYDNVGGDNWVLFSNPASATTDVFLDLTIAGGARAINPLPGYAAGQIPPGRTVYARYPGLVGGPVDAGSLTTDRSVVSQRILWPAGGNSLEEVPGTESTRLSSHFYWTWYDMLSAGYRNWVLVANPNTSQVYYEIRVAGIPRASGTIPAGQKVTPTFAGLMGGPVEVQAWTDSNRTTPLNVMASQRVLSNNGAAFNEVPGIPASELSDYYYWTWYDQQTPGAKNWVLVANPNTSQAYYEIRIAGITRASGTIPAGQKVTPTFAGVIGGPVEVQAWTGSGKTTPANVIASQRSVWGPSFEEVPGLSAGQLSSGYHWTWYDQQSAGAANWVLVANPNAVQIYYEVRTGNTLRASGTINAGQNVTPQFSGVMGGPVEVQAWTGAGKTTPAAVISSQRVVWRGHFNEVLGVTDSPVAVIPSSLNTNPPAVPVKLIFIHHSTGENWIADGNGNLGQTLMANSYFVSDTNYGWGPADADVGSDTIGDHTDIGHWYNWFAGPNRDTYMTALFAESGQNSSYTRMATDPGGANEIIMFKSCFPNSALGGNPADPPTAGANPLRGQDAGSEHMTVANVKGIYNDLLPYFAAHQEKLFVIITAPPLDSGGTNASQAANARAFNRWLVEDWLDGYAYDNVAVFDFYNVLTTNGGDANTSDAGLTTGNHHRFRLGAIEYITSQGGNYSAYTVGGDSHPTSAGSQKAAAEFAPLLNIAYNRWKGI